MDKLDFSGIEVGAQELVLSLEREGRRSALKTFENNPQGHQAIVGVGYEVHKVRCRIAALLS